MTWAGLYWLFVDNHFDIDKLVELFDKESAWEAMKVLCGEFTTIKYERSTKREILQICLDVVLGTYRGKWYGLFVKDHPTLQTLQ